MPWSIKDVERFKKGLTDKQKEQWVGVANSALERCLVNGGKQKECEMSAIRQANAVVNSEFGAKDMDKKILYAMPSGSEGFEKDTKYDFALFKKELIRAGTWKHPERDWTLKVTPERMDLWISNFDTMKRRGIKVPVPYGHVYNPKENTGFVGKLWRDNNILYGELEIPNENDIEKIGTTIKDVSIGLNPEFKDGEGNGYGEAIEHVALTNYPVVSAKDNFQKIAAGADKDIEIIPFSLIQESEVNNKNHVKDSNRKSIKFNSEGEKEMIEKLRKLLSLKSEATEEEIFAAAEKMQASLESQGKTVRELQTSLSELKKEATPPKAADEDEKILSSKAYLDLAGKTERLEAQLATERLNKINLALNRLQEQGKLTPAIRKEIDGGQVLTFSRETYKEDDVEGKEKIIKLFDMLPESAVIQMGDRTRNASRISDPSREKGIERERLISETQKTLNCSYKNALLSVSRERPELFER